MRSLRKYPDPVLTQKAKTIDEITDQIRSLAADMAETMYANDGIGLAAPQVGECCRLVVVDLSGPDERSALLVLVNPEIIDASDETVTTEEGCLSVMNYRSDVTRFSHVKVKAQDLDGNAFVIDAEDLLAICLQHEIDHLDGKLFIDRISRLKRAMYDKKVKKWQKQDETEQSA